MIFVLNDDVDDTEQEYNESNENTERNIFAIVKR